MESPFDKTPGMPTGQRNAYLPDELVMRVGVPHRGGSLAFHAFNEGFPVMVSANAFWDLKTGQFRVPEASNLYELDVALDSAGYTALKMFQEKGAQSGIAGVFPWTYGQYLELAGLINPSWYAQPDMCCEPEIAKSQADIDYRVNATATLLEGSLRVLYAWGNELAKTCSADTVASLVRPPVPVLQGWAVGDYQRSLDLLMQVWQRWEPWLASPALIGVGSVCRRSLKHPDFGLHAILAGLEGRLPQDSRLHMFGVKGAVLKDLKMMPFVSSADSMAYDFTARVNARKEGRSNSIANRSKEMTQWMQAAARKIMPAVGDQHRLMFNF